MHASTGIRGFFPKQWRGGRTMGTYFEKRECRRFEIPGAYIRFKKRGLLGMLGSLGDKMELLNISKGGLCIECHKEIKEGDQIMIHLHVPEGVITPIRGSIAWRKPTPFDSCLVGVKFAPFMNEKGCNSIGVLEKLRFLEKTYLDRPNS